MCYVVPFSLPCCRRTYVSVSKMKDCPADWPRTKCPKELCFQIGSQPDDRKEGTCWRCKAAERGIQAEGRERFRPGIDSAEIEKFIVPPEERRRELEEEGFCWFCGHLSECDACEAQIEARREKLLGKNNVTGEGEESIPRPVKRVRGGDQQGHLDDWQRSGAGGSGSSSTPKTRARTRSQGKSATPNPFRRGNVRSPSRGRISGGSFHPSSISPARSQSQPGKSASYRGFSGSPPANTHTHHANLAGIAESPYYPLEPFNVLSSSNAGQEAGGFAGYGNQNHMFSPPSGGYNHQHQQQPQCLSFESGWRGQVNDAARFNDGQFGDLLHNTPPTETKPVPTTTTDWESVIDPQLSGDQSDRRDVSENIFSELEELRHLDTLA